MKRKGQVNRGKLKVRGLREVRLGCKAFPQVCCLRKRWRWRWGWGEVSSDRVVWKPESCILTQRKASVSVALHSADM